MRYQVLKPCGNAPEPADFGLERIPIPRRMCQFEGCKTVLSRTNHEDYCRVHLRTMAPERGKCLCGRLVGVDSTAKMCSQCQAEYRRMGAGA